MKKTNKAFNAASGSAIVVSKIGPHDVHVVDALNPRSVELLALAYKNVYEPAFPIVEERESIEKWLKCSTDITLPAQTGIVLAGTDLDTDHPVVKSMSVCYYYRAADTGMMAYNATAPEYRNEGLGRVMVEARKNALLEIAKKNGQTLKGVFLECHNPAKISAANDSLDPATRIKIFEKWGAIRLPVDYVEPAITPGGEKDPNLVLLAYPHPRTGEYPTPKEALAFIWGIYTSCSRYSGVKPEDDQDYLSAKAQLEALPEQDKPLRPRPEAPKKPAGPAND